MIIAAAIRYNGVIKSLPAPARHRHIFNKIKLYTRSYEQGFIDDNYGFVDRETAAFIAINQNQIKEVKTPPRLYSNDLW